VNHLLAFTVADVQRELGGHDLACRCRPSASASSAQP